MDYYYWLARLYESENRIPEAASQLKKAVQLAPQNGFIVSEYGYFALKHLGAEEAVAAFEKFQKLPFKDGSRSHPCDILAAGAKSVTSYQDLKRMVSNGRPDHLCLGMALGRIGQWGPARDEFDWVLKADARQEPYEAYVAYARTPVVEFYLSKGHPAEALEIYRESLAFHPGDPFVESQIRELESAAASQSMAYP